MFICIIFLKQTRNLTRAFFVRYVRPEKTPKDIESYERQAIQSLKTIETGFLGRSGDSKFIIKSISGPTLADFLCYSEVSQISSEFGNTFDILPSEFPLLSQWILDMKSLPYHDETYAGLKALGDLNYGSKDNEGNELPSVMNRLGPATKAGLSAINAVLPIE